MPRNRPLLIQFTVSGNVKMEKEYHNIFDNDKLQSLIDDKGVINCDLAFRTSEIREKLVFPENITEIHGDVNIDSIDLTNLGSLKTIRGNLWVSERSILKSLNNLEKVYGDVILRYSNIEDLGSLTFVEGKLSVRDTPISKFENLKNIKGDFFLPKRLEGLSLKKVEVKGKVRYWNDKNTSLISELNQNEDWGPAQNKTFAEIHAEEIKYKKRVLTGEYLVKKCFTPSELNTYITRNIDDFFAFIDNELNTLYGSNYSFFQAIYSESKSVSALNQEFPKFKGGNKSKIDQKDVNAYIKTQNSIFPFQKYTSKLSEFKKTHQFKGYTSKYWLRYDENKLSKAESTGRGKEHFIYFIENSILQLFSIFVSSSQNPFRVYKGMPEIGQGWISETELYVSVKNYLKNYSVIQHGKPKWLGRQHVDVWIPKLSIGIEFHGKQHYEPVAHFGGEEAFKKNQERDKRKIELFKQNKAKLIEVTHGYSFDKLIEEIDKIINTTNMH